MLIVVYLSFAVDRMAMTGNSLVRWNPVGQKVQHCFGRQGLPMIWDFAESNFLATSTGSVDAAITCSSDPLKWMRPCSNGFSFQMNAVSATHCGGAVVSTDPPYYDNVGYADLSDFFYAWLRRLLGPVFPELFTTLAVPKTEELVASPFRHDSRADAELFFLAGMTRVTQQLCDQAHRAFPVTIYYAYKQSEQKGKDGAVNTGWEIFLEALIQAGMTISGTWPIHTEMRTRQVAMDASALASSIVLVCRRRPADAPIATRRDFIAALKAELPPALVHLQRGNIAPVDLAQAAIGPGMAVFTSYAKVLDASGDRISVGEATGADQPDPGRDARRAGGRLRCRQPLGAGVVRTIRFRRGRLRDRGDAVHGQEHQREWNGGGGYPPFAWRQGSVAAAGRTAGGLGSCGR